MPTSIAAKAISPCSLTYLYEYARNIILQHLDLHPRTHTVLFCTPYRARQFTGHLRTRRLDL